jgi:hypothetical protein
MLNITVKPGNLQGPLDVVNFSSPEVQSSPIKNDTGKSSGPGGPGTGGFAVLLRPGNSWYSPGNAFRLTLQATDGNLVLQTIDNFSFGVDPLGGAGAALDPDVPPVRWVPVWSAKTNGQGVTEAAFQIDGNLVAYAGARAVFNTGTSGRKESDRPTLFVQDDGNLVIYTAGPKAIWSTKTSALDSQGFNAPT